MRTKHLFAALMLPALFTACSNEELVSPVETVDLSDRPLAGNVKIDFGTGALTRLDANFNWEINDRIGACLMDEYIPGQGTKETSAPWMGDFKFVDYIQTNYRYTYNGNGTWENGDLLCTGNYFFYYPYTATLNARKAFEKYLNADQKLEGLTSASLRKLINENQMYVGYNYVTGATEGDLQPLNVDMKAVFAFPAFTIENTGQKERTIEKIALQHADGSNWKLVARIDPTQSGLNATTFLTQGPGKAVVWSETPELDKNAIGSAKQIQVTMPEGTKLASGGKLSTYIVVPAGEYAAGATADNIKMYIYTTEGVVTVDLSEKHINSSGTTKEYNVTNDVAFANISPEKVNDKYFLANITFDDLGVGTPDEMTVSSQNDLDLYLSWFKSVSGTGGTNLKITAQGDNVVLSKAATEILAANKTLNVTINGDVTIAEDVLENAFDLVNFSGLSADETKGQVVTNKGNLKIADANANVDGLKLVNDGTISLTSKSYAIAIENNGTASIDAVVDPSKGQYVAFAIQNKNFVNKGELTINSKVVKATEKENKNQWNGSFENYGTLTIAAGSTVEAKIDNCKKTNAAAAGKIVNKGTWNLYGTTGENYGTIENEGAINVPNSAKYENKAAWTYGNTTVTPSIVNKGSILNITNNGNVEMAQNASYNTVAIAANDAKGYIDNSAISEKITACSTETIYIKVTEAKNVSEVNSDVEDANARLVRFVNAGTLTVDEQVDKDGKVVENGIQKLDVQRVEVSGNLTIQGTNNVEFNFKYSNGGSRLVIGANSKVVLASKTRMTMGQYKTSTDIGYGSYIDSKNATAVLELNNSATLEAVNNIEFAGFTGTVNNYGTVKGDIRTITNCTWTGNTVVQ